MSEPVKASTLKSGLVFAENVKFNPFDWYGEVASRARKNENLTTD